MGLYDRIVFEDGLDVAFPPLDIDPYTITWQSKSITRGHPALKNYKVTAEGRLFKEDADWETVPEEERPRFDEDIGGFENQFEAAVGSLREIHLGWSDQDYHGIFEFHTSIDSEYVSLQAKFTDGTLVEVSRSGD